MLDAIILQLTDVNIHSTLNVQNHEYLKSFLKKNIAQIVEKKSKIK